MIVYWLVGFIGGLPVTVRPNMLVRSPVTGIVSFSCWPCTSSPYEIVLPPPDTTPSFTEQLALVHARAWSRRDRAAPGRCRRRPCAGSRRRTRETRRRSRRPASDRCRPSRPSVIASNGTFSSSATICLYAVCAVVWPKSTLPVRIRMVLSAWISNHELASAASSEFLAAAALRRASPTGCGRPG